LRPSVPDENRSSTERSQGWPLRCAS